MNNCLSHPYLTHRFCLCIIVVLMSSSWVSAQSEINQNNIAWTSPSTNAGQSMPCGGGDIGLNVWVENGDLLFYMARSGTFDRNNSLLKAGRVRLQLSPNPFLGTTFKQELLLQNGYVLVTGKNKKLEAQVKIWVDVFAPVIHAEVSSNQKIKATATYESWRYKDRLLTDRATFGTSYKWAPQGEIKTWKDEIDFDQQGIGFYHRNPQGASVFDVTVAQQGLQPVKDQLYDPLWNLTFGGRMEGSDMMPAGTTSGTYIDTDYKGWKIASRKPARQHTVSVYLHTAQTENLQQWKEGLQKTIASAKGRAKTAFTQTTNWWSTFWNRSYIYIQPDNQSKNDSAWQVGRNYQLMRYMLACNAYGSYPTKFNGGLFTYDPSLVDSSQRLTPDYRNWGGGTFTAQNQRLVYFPLLKSGDADLMKPQFDFYLRLLPTAELRSRFYWQHAGACFTEQLENFGLPNPAEYGWKRPAGFDKGMEYNAWLEYEWDTVLEFCYMMLEAYRYSQADIRPYLPFIESCLQFFDEHYQYLARQRGAKIYDGSNHLVLYPGSAAETYKMAYNSTTTIAALHVVLQRLIALPVGIAGEDKQKKWQALLSHIPPLSFASFDGRSTIAPALHWERINNTEAPQLYPVYPWGMYGYGKPGLDTAVNTYQYDTNVVKFRSHVGWKQSNIFAARLGLTEEAKRLTLLKMGNSGRRFPAFWGPGFDWTPDHNWGGSGMIGLQEMLVQTDDKKIFLFPAWPKDWDVHFKLHAPYQTTIEAVLKNGKVEELKVYPEERRKDVMVALPGE